MVKEKTFITIQAFMINELKLKGNELIIYAVIYGFSQDGVSRFTGGLGYLADWTNSTKQGVLNSLKKLIDKGLIKKNDIYKNNVKYCEYYSTNLNGVLNKVERGYSTKLNEGIKQSLPNNIYNNIKDNIYIKGASATAPQKRFIKPTVDEVQDYCTQQGLNISAQCFVDFYESKGWKVGSSPMKDWKAAARNWARRDKGSRPAKSGNLFDNDAQHTSEYMAICDGSMDGAIPF